ncbi:hypothetical protein CDD83_4986 [Cordyceps sp. RAO-2017]|nr:hypothetical protein CDD83_4986 [Cordyceps sp. RAO-2017]
MTHIHGPMTKSRTYVRTVRVCVRATEDRNLFPHGTRRHDAQAPPSTDGTHLTGAGPQRAPAVSSLLGLDAASPSCHRALGSDRSSFDAAALLSGPARLSPRPSPPAAFAG